MILYLHGFRSSPESFKAQALGRFFAEKGLGHRFFCPQLPDSPRESLALIAQMIEGYLPYEVILIGSSLGGFYATWVAEKIGCRAVLLNPVVSPWKVKTDHVDPEIIRMWENARSLYEEDLIQLLVPKISYPERYLLLAAMGDELLDHNITKAHYQGAKQIIFDGGSHLLEEVSYHFDDILAFCQ